MTGDKYSRAPWRAEFTLGTTTRRTTALIFDEDNFCIHEFEDAQPEHMNNAVLFAAAPDLLLALSRLLRAVSEEHVVSGEEIEEYTGALDCARNAIKKARGEA